MASDAATLSRLDRDHLIHPITEFRVHEKEGPPPIFTRGRGATLETADGRTILDAMSALANVNVGWGRTEIADAAAAQMREMSAYHSFYGFSAEPPSSRFSPRRVGG